MNTDFTISILEIKKGVDNRRIGCFDIAKAITTIWVSGFIHLIGYMGLSNLINYYPLVYFTTRICMATLAFVSGCLVIRGRVFDKQGTFAFFRRRTVYSYVPFLGACLFSGLEKIVINKWLFKDIRVFIKSIMGVSSIFTPAATTLWFICMIFIFYAVTPLIMRKNNIKYSAMVSLLIYSLFWILHKTLYLFDARVFLYYPFYIAGLLWRENYSKQTIKVIPLFLTVLFVSNILGWNNVRNYNYQFLVCVGGVPIFLTLCQIIEYIKGLGKAFIIVGKFSMTIYLFHRQIYYLLQYFLGGDFSIVFAYCVAFPIMIVMCFLLNIVIKRSTNKLNKLIELYHLQN